METSAVTSSAGTATQSLRTKAESAATSATPKAEQAKIEKDSAGPDLAAAQTVQESKPTVNTSGQTIGSTINTTA